ncbi:MAG: hypothetical protein ACI9LO_000805 [Planctomycetota bacterium]
MVNRFSTNGHWSPAEFLRVGADFNADGVLDYAQLIQGDVFDSEGFAVFLSTDAGHVWEIID